MAASGTTSDILPLNYMEIETAWHLLSVRIRQGSLARLAELTFRSALALNLVEILCRILGSPLMLTSGGFTSSSNVAIAACEEFTIGVSWYVPRDAFRLSELRNVSWIVSLTYVRKRKTSSLGNADVLLKSSKKRTLLTHDRGEGEPMKVEGLPKLLSHISEIPGKENSDVASPSGNGQLSAGMNSFDCSAVELDQTYKLPLYICSWSCFESRNISYTKEEGTRASDPYNANSLFPHKKFVDLSYEHDSLDVGLDANIIKEQAFQRLTAVHPD